LENGAALVSTDAAGRQRGRGRLEAACVENEFAEHVQFHQQGSKMVRSQEIGPADQV
jgi:hypothetical protein